ncbi:MAG: hypothetical protein CM1200mP22_27970 [Dehalococcoidia bacterium]|nr:MAG: hypothetical protein CM1200mP22_27970 [Dehalococcoidia bacterium]
MPEPGAPGLFSMISWLLLFDFFKWGYRLRVLLPSAIQQLVLDLGNFFCSGSPSGTTESSTSGSTTGVTAAAVAGATSATVVVPKGLPSLEGLLLDRRRQVTRRQS